MNDFNQSQWQQPQQPFNPYGPGAPIPPPPSKGLAIASMVLGIVSLALFCVFYLAIPCSIVAIILGGVSRYSKKAGKSMATAGIVCGIIALALAIVVIVLVVVLGVFSSTYNEYFNYFNS